jgi:hypothetical protein
MPRRFVGEGHQRLVAQGASDLARVQPCSKWAQSLSQPRLQLVSV